MVRETGAIIFAPKDVFDNQNTIITLEGIRTRTANERAAECAAGIKYNIAFKPGYPSFEQNKNLFGFNRPIPAYEVLRLREQADYANESSHPSSVRAAQ